MKRRRKHTGCAVEAHKGQLRLRFRWPVLPNGTIPNYGLATFRSMTSGQLLLTNDPVIPDQPLYFVQFGTFVTNSP